jgi:hypothetical protein
MHGRSLLNSLVLRAAFSGDEERYGLRTCPKTELKGAG